MGLHPTGSLLWGGQTCIFCHTRGPQGDTHVPKVFQLNPAASGCFSVGCGPLTPDTPGARTHLLPWNLLPHLESGQRTLGKTGAP